MEVVFRNIMCELISWRPAVISMNVMVATRPDSIGLIGGGCCDQHVNQVVYFTTDGGDSIGKNLTCYKSHGSVGVILEQSSM